MSKTNIPDQNLGKSKNIIHLNHSTYQSEIENFNFLSKPAENAPTPDPKSGLSQRSDTKMSINANSPKLQQSTQPVQNKNS